MGQLFYLISCIQLFSLYDMLYFIILIHILVVSSVLMFFEITLSCICIAVSVLVGYTCWFCSSVQKHNTHLIKCIVKRVMSVALFIEV
jgi:hypothetical protein